MNVSQSYLAVIVARASASAHHIDTALKVAGWAVLHAPSDVEAAMTHAAMLVTDGSVAAIPPWTIVAMVKDEGDQVVAADLRLSPDDSVEEMAAAFRRWLPPPVEAIERMEQAFGRAGLLPIVAGLRSELETALRADAAPDAHRLAGLSGTLGFAAASAAWRAVQEGAADTVEALHASRLALLAIGRWEAAEDHD